jgi:pyruvate-formate lyase-activating enzyme
MSNVEVLEPAIDPNNKITFLLDWEVTLKCNLDCSYCYSGHDNSTKHPALNKCLESLTFMFKYVDLYMRTKPKGLRYVVLNVYGGESLYHPDIVKILEQVHKEYAQYKDAWHLTVTTTTNAIVTPKLLESIMPFIDEFTVSYHTEHTEKQRQQFKNNLLTIRQNNKRIKCIVLMHPDPELFDDANQMIEWLEKNDIRHLPKQLDHRPDRSQFDYYSNQVTWFDNLYSKRSYQVDAPTSIPSNTEQDQRVNMAGTGRACCGGRQMCKDTNYKSRDFFVNN